MKKQINSVSGWSVKGIITLSVLSAVLCTFGANANNSKTVALNAVTVKMETGNGVESRMYRNNEAVEEYNAEGYAKAEMELEIQNWINEAAASNEAIEAELAPQFETQLSNNKYNSKEFVDVEMANESESRANSSGL